MIITKKRKMELIAGLIAILAAVLLLAIAIGFMTRYTAKPPETTPPTTPPTTLTAPPPTLVENPYSAGDFSYRDGYLTCISGQSLLGVDVSEYQGQIQWDRVKNAGVAFAMVRLGFRGWGSAGSVVADARGLENLHGAKAAGLMTGVYFFSQAISVEEAKEEAQFVLEQLGGQKLDLPIVFDWETVPAEDARTANMTAEKLNACAEAFCREIQKAGYKPMVYFNPDLARRMLDLLQLQQNGYDFWLAMYTDSMTYPYRVDMWQYTSGGSVDGIEGTVDLNLLFTYE